MEKQQRLIDANALPRFVIEVTTEKGIFTAHAVFETTIQNAPTIDAVPVVRCKDCVAVSVCNDELVCSRISEVMDGYYHGTVEIVKPDDYCSKGIRRSCAKMDGGAEDV